MDHPRVSRRSCRTAHLLLQLLLLPAFASAAETKLESNSARDGPVGSTSICVYSSASGKISCVPPSGVGRVTCSVRPPTAGSETEEGGPLPPRRYRLGPMYRHPWYGVDYFDVFRPRADGSYWQEHAETKDYHGRSRFGLSTSADHDGLSVSSRSCWRKLARAIDAGGERRRMLVHSPDEASLFSPRAPTVPKDYVAELVVDPSDRWKKEMSRWRRRS